MSTTTTATKPATHVTFADQDGKSVEHGRYTTSQAARRAGKKLVADGTATDFHVAKVEDVDNADAVLTGIEEAGEAEAEQTPEQVAAADEADQPTFSEGVILVEGPERKPHESLQAAKRRIAAERRVDKLMESLADGPTEIVLPVTAVIDEMTGTTVWGDAQVIGDQIMVATPAVEAKPEAPKAKRGPRPAKATGTRTGRDVEAVLAQADETWPMVQTLVDGEWTDVRQFGKRSAIRKVQALTAKGVEARAMLKGEALAV